MMISAVVLAKNEEKNIKECLAGLVWCDELIVIDDYSEDGTISQIRQIRQSAKKTRIYQRRLNGDFAGQRNFALEKAQGDWVLFVDADERVSPKLAQEIKLRTKTPAAAGSIVPNGYFFKRIDRFMGKWLKHGEIGGLGLLGGLGGIKILRLAKKESGKWARPVDETWNIRGKTETLRNPLLHYSHPDLPQFLENINSRSTLNARHVFDNGGKLDLFEWLKPVLKFFHNYFLKLGLLDGTPGFVFAVLMSLHSFLVRGKLYLLIGREQRKKEEGKMEKKEEAGKLLFLVWTVFVLISYIFFLYQRGKTKW